MLESPSTQEETGSAWRSETLVIAASAVIALLVRVWALQRRGIVDFDECYYYLLGRNLISGNGYTLNGLPHTAFPPLYPLLVGVAGAFTSSVRLATSAVSAIAGALVVVPVWFLARDVHGRCAALFAALAAAVWPGLFFFSALGVPAGEKMYAGSEPTYVTLVVSGATCLWLFARHGGFARAATAGLFFGLASLARSEGPVLFAFLFAWLVLDGTLTRRLFKARHAAGAALALVIMAAAYSPFLLYNRAVTGRWEAGAKLANNVRIRNAMWEWAVQDRPLAFARIHYQLDDEGARMADAYWGVTDERGTDTGGDGSFASGLAMIATAQKRWVPVWLRALYGGWRALVPWYLLAAIGLGVLTPPWGAVQLRWWLFFSAALASSLLIGVSLFVFARHLAVLAPLFAVAAGKGLESLARLAGVVAGRLKGTRAAVPTAGVILSGAILALMVVHGVELNLGGNRPTGVDNELGNQRAEKELAARLSEVLPAGSELMCLKPWVAVWGGFEWRVAPVAPQGRIAAYATANKIDFAILEPRMLGPSGGIEPLSKYHVGAFEFNGTYHLYDFRSTRDVGHNDAWQ